MNSDLAKRFGEILRTERKKAELSQEGLAFECDLDRTYISLLERGLRQPSLETVFLLADSLGLSASKLVSKVENDR